MVVMLWKDVFYSISVIALTIMVFEIVFTGGKWIERRFSWVYLGIVAALVALYRQNGIVPAFGTVLFLLFIYRNRWKPFAMAFLLAFVLWIGVRGPLYTAIDVDRDVNSGLSISLSHLVARYTNTDVPFFREDRALLSKIRPEDQWPYDCYLENALLYDGNYNYSFANENIPSLMALTIKLIYRNPKIFIDHLGCNGSFAYQITQPKNSGYETVFDFIFTNDLGLKAESKLPEIKALLDGWDGHTPTPFNWLVWRAPFWHGILFLGIGLYALRARNWRPLIIMAPVILNVIPLVFLTISQAYRFVFSSTLVGILMCMPFLLGCLSTSSNPLPLSGK